MNKVSIFMVASWTGLVGLIALATGIAFDAPQAVTIPATLVLIASSFALLMTRRADEYVAGLWNAGASAAFGTMLVLALGFGFIEGLIDGFNDLERGPSMTADTVLTLEIGAFYIGVFVKRLRGDI